MKCAIKWAGILSLTLLLASCDEPAVPMDLNEVALIPTPMTVSATGSSFKISEHTSIYVSGDLYVAEYLASTLRQSTGYELPVEPLESAPSKGAIRLEINPSATANPEAYTIEVDAKNLTIKAGTEHGVFNAIQTLRQMLPKEVEATSTQTAQWLVPSGKIADTPRFGYRGAMLDVSRHFFQVKDVKRYIDLLSRFKINRLHMHLSDDQGWRIEIKKWPKLTSVGGLTQVGGGTGGYYTQEQYKEIVAYAQSRFITVVPEIDMPGHTNAALVAYPELNCNKKDPNPKAYTGTRVGFSTFCTSNEKVYTFLDDVIGELAAMTPGEYIHIGGDESHVTAMKDYIPFIERAQAIVTKHGKKSMGWDEIAHAKLTKDAVVHFWNEADNAKMGIAQGAKVLMSPATRTYLDMQYDSTTHLGLHWAAYIEIDSSYIWDPAAMSPGITESDILGIESPLWSETVTNMDEIEYMAFPRVIGHAEIGWSPQSKRNWDDYKSRLATFGDRLQVLGIDYYKSKQVWE